MDELQPTAVIALTGIRVLPGTGMVEIALRDGQIDADDNLLYPKFYISPTLGDELIERIEALRAQPLELDRARPRHQDQHRRCCRSCASARSRDSCGGCCDERRPAAARRQARAGDRRVARHRARHGRGAGGGRRARWRSTTRARRPRPRRPAGGAARRRRRGRGRSRPTSPTRRRSRRCSSSCARAGTASTSWSTTPR